MGVQWMTVDPPETSRRRSKWKKVADELKTRPGVWAIVHEYSAAGGGSGPCTSLKRQGCEAVTRTNGDGTSSVWARWPK